MFDKFIHQIDRKLTVTPLKPSQIAVVPLKNGTKNFQNSTPFERSAFL